MFVLVLTRFECGFFLEVGCLEGGLVCERVFDCLEGGLICGGISEGGLDDARGMSSCLEGDLVRGGVSDCLEDGLDAE